LIRSEGTANVKVVNDGTNDIGTLHNSNCLRKNVGQK